LITKIERGDDGKGIKGVKRRKAEKGGNGEETRDYRCLPNTNRTQAAERAENVVFVPGDLGL